MAPSSTLAGFAITSELSFDQRISSQGQRGASSQSACSRAIDIDKAILGRTSVTDESFTLLYG